MLIPRISFYATRPGRSGADQPPSLFPNTISRWTCLIQAPGHILPARHCRGSLASSKNLAYARPEQPQYGRRRRGTRRCVRDRVRAAPNREISRTRQPRPPDESADPQPGDANGNSSAGARLGASGNEIDLARPRGGSSGWRRLFWMA